MGKPRYALHVIAEVKDEAWRASERGVDMNQEGNAFKGCPVALVIEAAAVGMIVLVGWLVRAKG